jgi:hypothetical protein
MRVAMPAAMKAPPVKYAQKREPGSQWGMSDTVSFTSIKWAMPKKIKQRP